MFWDFIQGFVFTTNHHPILSVFFFYIRVIFEDVGILQNWILLRSFFNDNQR